MSSGDNWGECSYIELAIRLAQQRSEMEVEPRCLLRPSL